MYIGFELTEECRRRLLQAVPPLLPRVVCHHVTLYHGADSADRLASFGPEFNDGWEAIGLARGPEVVALVVAHNGNTVRDRYDRKVYHCTHSLAEGRKAVESNALIERQGWQPLAEKLPLQGRVRLKR